MLPLHIYKRQENIPVSNNDYGEHLKRMKREFKNSQQHQSCSTLPLPIVKKVIDGVTYYNTSVSHYFTSKFKEIMTKSLSCLSVCDFCCQ